MSRIERWTEIKPILDEALSRPRVEREAWLREACADRALRAEVASYLALDDEEDDDLLDRPVFDVNAEDRNVGRRVGPYRLLEPIGRGGMGVVYLAARVDDFDQRAAIKLIKRGMDSDEILRRFENERQILASLEHPHIARLLDGGTTDDGVPFFAMERVEGVPLDDYCSVRALPLVARLRLYLDLCGALSVCHRNLIVHRDLKPGNVLVTEQGVLKLLDFGIAKLLADDGSAFPAVTQLDKRPMSTHYASPEQVLGQPVTTASDIYSLGVLLYQLITGRHPYVDAIDESELVCRICTIDPPRPSTMAKALSAEVGDAGIERRLLRGDLDSIVLKAMQKDPSARYRSVDELADDIVRYLEGRPVHARDATMFYRARKFVRRNTLPIGIAAAMTLVTGAGAAQWIRAERNDREVSAQIVWVLDFLLDEVINSNEPDAARGEPPTVAEILGPMVNRIDEAFASRPRAQVELFRKIGRVYSLLGSLENAEDAYRRALEVLQRTHEVGDSKWINTLSDLATVSYKGRRFEAARQLATEALEMAEGAGWPSSQTLTIRANLGNARVGLEQTEEGEALLLAVANERRASRGQGGEALATVLISLANVYYGREDMDAAESMLVEALTIRRAQDDPQSVLVANALSSLASVQMRMNRFDEAKHLLDEALSINESRRADHFRTSVVRRKLAYWHFERGQFDEAIDLARVALDGFNRKVMHGDIRSSAETLVEALLASGRSADASSVLGVQIDRWQRDVDASQNVERWRAWRAELVEVE